MTLTDLLTDAHRLSGVLASDRVRLDALDSSLIELRDSLTVLTGADEALQAVLAAVQTELQEDVVKLVTYGLRVVFEDQRLGFQLALTEKRGAPWCDALLTQDKQGVSVTAPVLEAFGGGPATLIAFLLRVLTIRRTGLAPVLILDEPFSMVSASYRDLVGKLLRELADKAGITILMVTHEREYLDTATKAYEIVEGAVGSVCREVTA